MMAELLWAEMRLAIDKAKERVNHCGDVEESEVAVEAKQEFCVERSSSSGCTPYICTIHQGDGGETAQTLFA